MPDFPDPALPSEGAAPVRVKGDIRASLLAARRAMPAEVRAKADAAICAALAVLVRSAGPARLAGYVPLPGEPGGADLPAVLADAVAPGELLLPVLAPDLDLDWAAYAGPESLRPAGRGLREPTGPRLGVRALAAAELVIVPAVAVDRHGVRLGRGGGSYDRALTRVGATVLVVAPLYDGEVLDRLPAQDHDRPVGAIVTPGGGFSRLRD